MSGVGPERLEYTVLQGVAGASEQLSISVTGHEPARCSIAPLPVASLDVSPCRRLGTATDGVSGTELWKSDGTAAGTVLVKDIRAGSAASGAGPVVAGQIDNVLAGVLFASLYLGFRPS
jgi:ELWxxDGT repeat protein